MLEIMSPFY